MNMIVTGVENVYSAEVENALPLAGVGKVLKTRLREPHWSGQQRQIACGVFI